MYLQGVLRVGHLQGKLGALSPILRRRDLSPEGSGFAIKLQNGDG